MAEVFLSWSGDRSKSVAHVLYHWLPKVMPNVKPWMSTDDIPAGRQWSFELEQSLKSHGIGIICVTPENHLAPWLTFEAGALSHSIGEGKVIPFLLGMPRTMLHGPLKQFQCVTLEQDEVWRLLWSLNAERESIAEDVLRERFSKFWPEFNDAMAKIAQQRASGDNSAVDDLVRALVHHGIDNPVYGTQVHFDEGFETYDLYSAVTEAAKKRLLVFGRKNRKLFDKNYNTFLRQLKRRVSGGFDFRVMFLDPDAPSDVLYHAHQDSDLADQLRDCIKRASETLKSQVDPGAHCRMYRIARTIIFLVVDDVVIYSSLALDKSGRAKPLTHSAFAVVSASIPVGRDMVENFETLWAMGKPIPGDTVAKSEVAKA